MIIGGPGAGKSYLARLMSVRLGLPVTTVDDLVRSSGNSPQSAEQIDGMAITAAEQDRWIIEGGNTRTYAVRVARADLLIRLCPPRPLRLLRVLRRRSVSRQLLFWTWRYDAVFGAKDRAAVEAAKARSIRVLELARRADVERFVGSLPA